MERIQVELADRCLGDGIGLRVPPGRADQLRHQQLVKVRISLRSTSSSARSMTARASAIRSVNHSSAAQLERDLTAPPGVGEELETGAQVVGRCRAVRPPLPKAELDQHLCPRCRIKLLLERG